MTSLLNVRGSARRRHELFGGRVHWSVFGIVTIAVGVAVTFLAGYPLARILSRLVVSDGQVSGAVVTRAFTEPDVGVIARNTALLVFASMLLGLAIGGLLAWLTERTDARLPWFGGVLPILPFLLPAIAGTVGWVMLLSRNAGLLNSLIRSLLDHAGVHLTEGPFDIHSWYGMVFLYTVYQVPFAYLLMSAGFRNLDSSLEEQARISGAGVLRTFWRVSFPALWPSMGAAVLLMVWFGIALFPVPAIVGPEAGIPVLSVQIVRLMTFTYPSDFEGALALSLYMLGALTLVWYLQRRLLARSGRYAVIGGRSARPALTGLGLWKLPARLFMIGYVGIVAVLPTISLAIVALNGYWSPTPNWSGMDMGALRLVYDDVFTRNALINSLKVAFVVATVAVAAAAVVALYVQRGPRVITRPLDAVVKFPATVPPIVKALGFVLAFGGAPFFLNGTYLILVLAFIIIFLPQASVIADAAASQVGADLREAAFINGASRARTFLRVELPLMLPGLAVGWALVFVWSVAEISAAAILAGTRNVVVGFRILEIFNNGQWSELAALSLVVMIINLVVVGLVMLAVRRRRGSLAVPQRAAVSVQ